MKDVRIAILGGGILGICNALELDGCGRRSTLFDGQSSLLQGASRWAKLCRARSALQPYPREKRLLYIDPIRSGKNRSHADSSHADSSHADCDPAMES